MNILNFDTEHFRFVSYTLLTKEQSYKIWEGRNHPEIRKWMSNQEPFSFEDHVNYVESLKGKEDRIHLGVFKEGNELIGAVALNPYFKDKKEGESGRFLLPQYIGLGLGEKMSREFIEYLFCNDIVNRIYAKTRIENSRNQNLNQKLGFRVYNRDREYVYMEICNIK